MSAIRKFANNNRSNSRCGFTLGGDQKHATCGRSIAVGAPYAYMPETLSAICSECWNKDHPTDKVNVQAKAPGTKGARLLTFRVTADNKVESLYYDRVTHSFLAAAPDTDALEILMKELPGLIEASKNRSEKVEGILAQLSEADKSALLRKVRSETYGKQITDQKPATVASTTHGTVPQV